MFSLLQFITFITEPAYQQTPFTGFRTFVKGTAGATSFQAMPFAPHFSEPTPGQKPNRTMSIAMNEMEINERDPVTHLHTSVLYFTVPEEEFACMVRRVTFTNEGTEDMELQVIDGLAKLEPSGIPNGNLDSMGRTMEVGWAGVHCVQSTVACAMMRSRDICKLTFPCSNSG